MQPVFAPTVYSGGALQAVPDARHFEGYQPGILRHCPGGATQPPPDGSAPVRGRGLPNHRRPARPMRRLIYICLFVAIVPWIVIGIVREATDDDTKDHYFVRAIFDNASSIVSGEDVKVAGVPVGVVSEHGRDRRQEGRGHAPDRRREVHARSRRTPPARSASRA